MRLLNWSDYVRLALSYAVFSQDEDGAWTVEVPVMPAALLGGKPEPKQL